MSNLRSMFIASTGCVIVATTMLARIHALGASAVEITPASPLPSPLLPLQAPREISVGEEVKDALAFHADERLYELTAPSDGTLVVHLSLEPEWYIIWLWLADTLFTSETSSPILAKLPVVVGEKYRISVVHQARWDYGGGFQPFVLTTSMEDAPGQQPVGFTVEADAFADGGQGCWQGPFYCGGGYYDETSGNWGDAQVRPETDVDLWYDDGGIVIGGLDGLEWLTFPVTVPQTGRYRVTFRTASPADRPSGSGVVNVGVYGVDGSWIGNQPVPVTGGAGEWHQYLTWDAPTTIYLPAGAQTLTMWAAGGWYNVRHITFTLTSPPPPPQPGDDYSGLYTLTITADSCSPGFPEEAKRRVYTARVEQAGADLWVYLSGADFLPFSGTFGGAVRPTGEISFTIAPASLWDYGGTDLQERLSDGTVLWIFGIITASSTPAGISGTISRVDQDSGLGGIYRLPVWPFTGSCYIDRFEMVPRS
jgi:hypothetical protein